MCLITVAPKGTNKNSDFLFNSLKYSANNNQDGSGFMYKRNGENFVNLEKGYWDVNELIEDIKKLNLTEEDELVVHHRIATKGEISQSNTHPFIVSEDEDEIGSVSVSNIEKPVMAHNGGFSGYGNELQSDTFCFVKEIVAQPELIALLKRSPKIYAEAISGRLGSNKLAFLFPDRDLVLLGEYKTEDGYYFSHSGYKSYYTPPVTKHNHHVANHHMMNKHSLLLDKYNKHHNGLYLTDKDKEFITPKTKTSDIESLTVSFPKIHDYYNLTIDSKIKLMSDIAEMVYLEPTSFNYHELLGMVKKGFSVPNGDCDLYYAGDEFQFIEFNPDGMSKILFTKLWGGPATEKGFCTLVDTKKIVHDSICMPLGEPLYEKYIDLAILSYDFNPRSSNRLSKNAMKSLYEKIIKATNSKKQFISFKDLDEHRQIDVEAAILFYYEAQWDYEMSNSKRFSPKEIETIMGLIAKRETRLNVLRTTYPESNAWKKQSAKELTLVN